MKSRSRLFLRQMGISLAAGWAFCCLADNAPNERKGAESFPHVRWVKVISSAADRYCGWPTVASTGENGLVAVFSGGRDGHVCPWGRVKLVRSEDGGESWGASADVPGTVLDDRDAGILKLANDDWLVFWFSSVFFYETPAQRKRHPDYARHFEKLPLSLVRDDLGSFAMLSSDKGKTWKGRVRVPVSTPHGPIQLRDGRLLVAGNQDSSVRGHLKADLEENGLGAKDWRTVRIAESRDNGLSWQEIGLISDQGAPKGGELCEPCLVEATDGTLYCYIRNMNLLCSKSADGGRTWSEVRRLNINAWESPAHVIRLQNGKTLLTTARRVGWSIKKEKAGGLKSVVYALVGDANGTPESFEAAREVPIYDPGPDSDMGYATTAQTSDGSLVTVCYAHHHGAAAVVVAAKWDLPKE